MLHFIVFRFSLVIPALSLATATALVIAALNIGSTISTVFCLGIFVYCLAAFRVTRIVDGYVVCTGLFTRRRFLGDRAFTKCTSRSTQGFHYVSLELYGPGENSQYGLELIERGGISLARTARASFRDGERLERELGIRFDRVRSQKAVQKLVDD